MRNIFSAYLVLAFSFLFLSSGYEAISVRVSPKGIEHLKSVEGLRLASYWDRGQYAIGYGHRSPDIGASDTITHSEALRLLAKDIGWAEREVNRHVKVPLSQGQYDALVSFVYNIGPTRFRKSTLLRVLNSGQYDAVPAQIMRWRKPSGIIGRRKKEVALWKSEH